MARSPVILWLMFIFTIYGCFSSPGDFPLEEKLEHTVFTCMLNLKETYWSMGCESDNFVFETLPKFFAVKLQGKLNLESPVLYSDLLNATSFHDSKFYLCENQWKYLLHFDPDMLFQHCENCNKYFQKLTQVLNETSVKYLKIYNISKPEFALNILSECSRVVNVVISNNFLPNLSLSVHLNVIRSLSLKGNAIENITDGIFGNLSRLTFLDLSYNRLTYVNKNLFNGTSALKKLDMSHNRIESMASDAFSNLVSLKSICLRNNKLQLISNNTFRFSNFLSIIDISNNDLKNISTALFQNMPNLKNISCSNCNLFNLHKDIFLNSPNLVWIDFSCNHIQVLHEDFFKTLKYLEVVDLGNNKISSLSGNSFQNQPYLSYLNLTDNGIPYLKTGIFAGAPNIKLLDLSKNKLKTLNDDHIKNFTDLEYLGLNHNMIVTVQLGVTTLVKIRNLNIAHNLITKFNVGWKQLIYLESFNIDYNQLTSINVPPCVPSVKQTVTFSFKHNKISKVNMDALVADERRVESDRIMMSECFFNGMVKNYVDLTNNPLLCDCELYPFYKYVYEKSRRKYQLDTFINEGNLTCADPPLLRNSSLVLLPDDLLSCNLSDRCPSICFCGIRGKDNFTFVNCSSRSMKEVPQTIPYKTTVLYFNRNQLCSMSSLNTDDWSNIIELHLDDNLLADLNDWKVPTSLRYLSVRGNKLKILPNSLMQLISNLSYFQLYFGNNDKNCDCDRKRLKIFLLKYAQFVKDNANILCVVTSNGTSELLPLTSVPESDLCPQSVTNYQKSLIISLCVSFTVLISLMLIYYRQRQLILSFCYIHCDDLFRLFYVEEEDDDKIFDAFVAYSSNDREIVLKLLEELETNPPCFRLCIHERNWLPGHFITESIANSVECSRRTIIILSSTFIASPWFNVELRAAVFQMSKNKMNRIIVILADKSVSLDNIDPELRHVISKRTYLVWGERWFWEKLRYALPRKKKDKRFALRNSRSNSGMSEMSLLPDVT